MMTIKLNLNGKYLVKILLSIMLKLFVTPVFFDSFIQIQVKNKNFQVTSFFSQNY